MNVKACVKKILFPFIQKEFPEVFGLYRKLYSYPAPFGAGRSPRNYEARKELQRRREFLKNLIGEYNFPSLKFPKAVRSKVLSRKTKVVDENQMRLKI